MLRNNYASDIARLEKMIEETKTGVEIRERWMREGSPVIDLEVARVRLFGMRKALQRLQGD